MPRELVGKRYKGTADLHQSIPRVYIGDIGELQIRNIEQLGKLHPVCTGLIQHDNKLAVPQHGACRAALQQIVHILRNPIQDFVEYNYADWKKLLAQVENIVADEPIADVDVGRASAMSCASVSDCLSSSARKSFKVVGRPL